MNRKIRCLIVSSRQDSFGMLESVLDALPIKILRVRSCLEAAKFLAERSPAHLVLTDPVLADGNWRAVLALAEKLKVRVNVILVSPRADIELYLDAMDHGAFDFITESFSIPELVHVLRMAIEDACQARGEPVQVLSAFRRADPRVPLTQHEPDGDSAIFE